jgi:putative endonuclease
MAYFVYILLCNDDRLYVGQTNNLDDRIKRHRQGLVNSTKHRRPVVCIYTQSFETRADAMKREAFLKSLWGAREKKKILKEYHERFSA